MGIVTILMWENWAIPRIGVRRPLEVNCAKNPIEAAWTIVVGTPGHTSFSGTHEGEFRKRKKICGCHLLCQWGYQNRFAVENWSSRLHAVAVFYAKRLIISRSHKRTAWEKFYSFVFDTRLGNHPFVEKDFRKGFHGISDAKNSVVPPKCQFNGFIGNYNC